MANTSISNMEYVRAIRYNIPVETDIVSVILNGGLFDHAIGGPGLASDVLKQSKKAHDGRLYLIYTTEPKRMIDFYDEANHAVKADSTFTNLYVCDDAEYAVAVVNPFEYGLRSLPFEYVRLMNKDCLMKYMEPDIGKGIDSEGTYIFMPKDLQLEGDVKLITRHPVLNKFAQIYIKAYQRLGFDIAYDTFAQTWKWICAKNNWYNAINDDIRIDNWIKGLPNEPLTSML
jgi:hypothetical protein